MNALADRLTAKQEQVILGWINGMRHGEIAEIMRTTNQAVSSMGRTVCKKLGAATPYEACYLWGKHESRLQAD